MIKKTVFQFDAIIYIYSNNIHIYLPKSPGTAFWILDSGLSLTSTVEK